MLAAKKRIWIEILLHIAFWAGVLYTLTSLNSSHIHVRVKTDDQHIIVSDQYEKTTISSYVYLTLAFLAVLFYGNIFWVFRKAIRYKSALVRLVICAGWFIMVFATNYFIVGPLFDHVNRAIAPPRGLLMRKQDFKYLLKPDSIRINPRTTLPPPQIDVVNFMISSWLHLQPVLLLAFLAIMVISIAYFFLKEWSKSELIHTQLQANQLSTEIKFLKSQINPHFLFNTLNNLFSMAQGKGNDELADGIWKLSEMMRYMLHESNAELVSLKNEIEYLKNSITLNKLRSADDEVILTFNYPEHTDDLFIAPMIFIPFVENAFKHGLQIGESSAITIVISTSGKQLTFFCENKNYGFIKKMENIGGIGLENVKRRLQLVYPGKHELLIKNDGDNYAVTLKINLA